MAQTGTMMGLRIWNLLDDRYSHDQLKDNFFKLDLHDHSPGRGTPVPTGGIEDGAVTAAKLAPGANSLQDATVTTSKLADDSVTANKLDDATVLAQLGLNGQGVVRRGKQNIPGSESRTNAAYGTLTTPDVVADVVLPTDGLIVVMYSATWLNATASAGRAAIFLDNTQLVVADNATTTAPSASAPVVQAAVGPNSTDSTAPLVTFGGGLAGAGTPNNQPTEATTGQAVGWYQSHGAVTGTQGKWTNGSTTFDVANIGAPCYVFAAAGTYDVGVRFKSASGAVTVKNRKLWVWSIAF